MDSLTHFHARMAYFYTHFSNNLKVTALGMFQKNLGSHPLKSAITFEVKCEFLWLSSLNKSHLKYTNP